MSLRVVVPSRPERLSRQLQALSELGESLTLRLLEVEERLDRLEQTLAAVEGDLADPAPSGKAGDLDRTGPRLQR
jgi:hypothetical protein